MDGKNQNKIRLPTSLMLTLNGSPPPRDVLMISIDERGATFWTTDIRTQMVKQHM